MNLEKETTKNRGTECFLVSAHGWGFLLCLPTHSRKVGGDSQEMGTLRPWATTVKTGEPKRPIPPTHVFVRSMGIAWPWYAMVSRRHVMTKLSCMCCLAMLAIPFRACFNPHPTVTLDTKCWNFSICCENCLCNPLKRVYGINWLFVKGNWAS